MIAASELKCGCYQRIAGYPRDTEAWSYCEVGAKLRHQERMLGYRITDATFACRAGVPSDQAAVDRLTARRRRISRQLDRHLDILRH